MRTEEHPSRADIGEWLRRGDPHRGERLDASERAAMREEMTRVHAAARSSRRRRRQLVAASLLFALVLGSILSAGLQRPESATGPAALPSVPRPSVGFAPPELEAAPALVRPTPEPAAGEARPRSARRSIRLTAPGGTRIVWTLDPTFELDRNTR